MLRSDSFKHKIISSDKTFVEDFPPLRYSTYMSKKSIVSITASVIAVLLSATIIISISASRKPVIAFYDLDSPTENAVKAALGEDFSYVTLNTHTSLSYQVKKAKAAALFTKGAVSVDNAKELASKKALLPQTALNGMTSSIRALATPIQNGSVSALPILTDHLEVNIDNNLLKATKVPLSKVPFWNDLTKFALAAAKRTSNPKIVFAGKESDTLIDILGALCESIEGRPSYDTAIKLINMEIEKAASEKRSLNGTALADVLAASPTSPLFSAAQMISQWRAQNILYPDVFSLTSENLDTLMEMELASLVIMPLSVHRTIGQQTIQRYTSIYLPSYNPASNRFFTAPVVYAVPLLADKKVLASLETLSSAPVQEKLSRASGLAPVLAQCRTPDRQADNVRYWVAASNTPLCGLSREVPLTSREKDELALALKALIIRPKN